MNKAMVVPVSDVPSVWPDVEPFFYKVLERNQDYASIGFIYNKLIDGSYTLLAIHDETAIKMAMVCEVVVCPTGRKILMIPHLAGVDMSLWLPTLVNTLFALAADLDCAEIMISGGRMGWVKEMKKYGGELSHVTVVFDVEKNKGITYG